MSKELTLVPVQGVVVQRDGQQHRPEIGKPFKFTAEEVEDIRAAEKTSGSVIVRKPVVEGNSEEAARAAGIQAKAEATLAELVKKSQDADAAAAAKPSDTKLAEVAARAKTAVRKHCEATGLDVPAGFKEEAL